MLSLEEYKKDPCKASSVPWWKTKSITVPADMKIVHDSAFDKQLLDRYTDKRFFRLLHRLSDIPDFPAAEIECRVLSPDKTGELAAMINSCYTHAGICVSAEDIQNLTKTRVWCPALWMGAFLDGRLVGSLIGDFDREAGEAVVEWLQVLPAYRRRGIAAALLGKALKTMRGFADFATVSGECGNVTNPERVYRRCGFEGEDVWHILTERS